MATKIPRRIENVRNALELGLLETRAERAIARAEMLGVGDKFTEDYISRTLYKHEIRQAFSGPFPLPKLNHGDFVLGLDMRGRPIRCPSQNLNSPILTTGSTGCGKTTKSLVWIPQMASIVLGCWLIDVRKCEFAQLRLPLELMGVSLSVVPARSLRWNPLQPPVGTDPREYAPNISEVLVRVLELPQRATKLIHSKILQLYMKPEIPTLFDLDECVAGDAKANPQARQAVLDSLRSVLMSLRDVLCYRRGWTTHDLARRHIVFEFGGVSDTEKDLLLNTLVLSEFMSRISRGVSNPRMDLFIVVDEAARLVGSENNSISDLIGIIRGTGIGLDLSLQSAEVSRTILSNTPNKFIGRVTSYTDLEAMGSSMGLTQDQRRWISRNLVPGMFVGQLGQGSWRHPFLFRVPRLNLKNQAGSNRGNNSNLLRLPSY